MATPTRFSKEDIGGEILPILTTGLYRDTLDALREYIQNAIDAKTTEIELIIDPSTITVCDSGHGMSPSDARRAIRLGISDKNPTQTVGFRGIGIYSAFNLCDSLEIFTKSESSRVGSRIVFRFGDIRKELLKEQERRKQGLGPKLYLEKLLESSVFVEDDVEGVIRDHGTRLILTDLLSDSYRHLRDWDKVMSYLQNVVPLPFHPDFRYGKAIEKKFAQEDYRVVPLTLQIGARKERIYRPYENGLFSPDAEYSPKYFSLTKGKERFGFAWVCINGRKVIKDNAIRGLLLRKFDFSIGTRRYLDPFFKRIVFHNRVTGEVVVQHPSVLPNAARTDFENNSARQDFLEAVASFIGALEKWANEIQEESKAEAVLSEVRGKLEALAERLPSVQRDKDEMLRANVEISDCKHRLETHKRTLQTLHALERDHSAATKLLKDCQTFVNDALRTSKGAQKKVEDDLVRVVQSEIRSKKRPRSAVEDAPTDLVSALQSCGISLGDDAQRAIRLFENELLLDQLKRATYIALLSQLVELLEEEL
jgi:molecular chaperone HtpG